MGFENLPLENHGEGEKISQQEVQTEAQKLADVQACLSQISESKDTAIRKRLENSNLQEEVLEFLEQAANNSLASSLSEFNASEFDNDGEDGLDRFEFEKFHQALEGAIEQIIILDGIDVFSDIHEESTELGSSWWQEGLSTGIEKGVSAVWEKIDTNTSPEELERMRKEKFSFLSLDSWTVLYEEFGAGIKDVLKFLVNMPAAGILYFTEYRDLDEIRESGSPQEKVGAEIKIKELIEKNPALGIAELSWEMFEQMWEQIKSGTNEGVAIAILSLAGAGAIGFAGVKIAGKAIQKGLILKAKAVGRLKRTPQGRNVRNRFRDGAKKAGVLQRGAERVDDIVGGAGIGHLTGAFGSGSEVVKVGDTASNFSDTERLFLETQIKGNDIYSKTQLENLLVPQILKEGTECKYPSGELFVVKEVKRDPYESWIAIDENGKEHRIGFSISDWIEYGVIPDSPALQQYNEILRLKESGEGELILNQARVREAQQVRNRILEGQGRLTLNREDFSQYFTQEYKALGKGLNQRNVLDCYLVAAIDAMSHSPHFELMMRTSLKKLPNGDWEVKIPLMDPSGETIIITQKEIQSQWNPNLKDPKKVIKGFGSDLLRPKLAPMKANEGYRVLEAAFIKHKFGKVDRAAAERGWTGDVLEIFGGDFTRRTDLKSSKWNPDTKEWEYPGLKSLDEHSMKELDTLLNSYDPNIHIATASTPHNLNLSNLPNRIISKLGFYKADGSFKFFVPGHAYSIQSIDPTNKVITLANPWNTTKPITLTFDDFKATFSNVTFVRIDNDKLLQRMENLEREAA